MLEMNDERVIDLTEDVGRDGEWTAIGRRWKRARSAVPQGLRHLLFWLFVLMLGLGSRAAYARASCTSIAETITVTMPASITVPRDAAVGTVLTAWVSTAATNNYFNCQRSGSGATGAGFEPLSMTAAGMTVTNPNGRTYTVWNTNVPGVGIAIGVRVYLNSCNWQNFIDLGSRSPIFPSPWVGQVCSGDGNSLANGGQAEMALVKIGPITGGTVNGGVLFEAAAVVRQGSASDYTMQPGRKSFSLTPIVIKQAACTTPNVTVSMGSHKQSAFTGVGSTTPAVAVNVGVNACPAGLNSIQYQFIPVNAVLDAANGVLALSSDSTAAGIGLQLKDNNGKALAYNTQYALTGYNSSTGGSYTIPFTANYYQTSATVTPGTANAVLTFTLTYQ
ncbi:pilus assembly protein [Burkholderia cepacia]|uniref:fimbrial protein n=1 Tax=Burkholderia cepacia TaxID=292 RepID=UPI00075A769C|nr:fimbrial protein [Burkholderia cepacia]KVQ34602.1 pilus assembly protein [Burkholderia cepacia]